MRAINFAPTIVGRISFNSSRHCCAYVSIPYVKGRYNTVEIVIVLVVRPHVGLDFILSYDMG